MISLRTFLARRPGLCALLLVAALCLKVLLPAGHMLSPQARLLTVQLCADGLGRINQMQLVIPLSGSPEEQGKQSREKGVCAFSALAMAAAPGADAVQLALAFAILLLIGLASVPGRPAAARGRLRPPLRGPPARA